MTTQNELTKVARLQINTHYEQIKNLLLAPSSYEHDLKTDNANIYLSFVENALETNYERITHIYFFIEKDLSMSEAMYPFCHLKSSTKEQIETQYYLCKWISEGLEEVKQQSLWI